MHIDPHHLSNVGMTMLQGVPTFLPFIFTWVKTAAGITLIAKAYGAFDEGHEMGDKIKKILPHALGLAAVFAPNLIKNFLPSDAGSGGQGFLDALAAWRFNP
jgi:hypothetical protein